MTDLVFTLSAIPPRFPYIGDTLECLLGQRRRADRIELNIPRSYRRFPDWDGSLPRVPAGVEIVRVEKDLGPATKVLFTARRYRGQDVNLLLCDDDRAYRPDWSQRFLDAARRHPGCAIAKRGIPLQWITRTDPPASTGTPRALDRPHWRDVDFHLRYALRRMRHGRDAPRPERRLFRRSGYIEIFEGCGGVLLRPEFFDDVAFDIPDEAWMVDDVWLSGMLARRGIPIWLLANTYSPRNTAARLQSPLGGIEVDETDRKQENRTAVAYLQETFGIW